ncbi:carboxylate-amine ligase [Halopolyspora algeriensis]|uniref:Putative glutamate--cysteine ligase 2 n=1 Tax=Halopolyspora algeriensis TaxID=1500506 RepID=A0A368VRT5_9ACTN|nr:glutamate--cysteine ligase [Halopolyspora algeriensis]RCW44610.1 carboxylate-amine ligase [Halopolyspora algeriensis]TQM55971.1 carboxylate-amine ligase [Halopolyspora algeriensis]
MRAHAPPDAATATGATFGVEEEFLLVDDVSGRPFPGASPVLARVADRLPAAAVHPELMETQVEASTGICTTLPELRGQLRKARDRLGAAAGLERVRLVSSGTPPLSGPPPPVSPGERFTRSARIYGGVITDYQACGCHVHVGVPDRDTAVAVINHLRPWLPTLLALSGNSPFHGGSDTGYASWRMVQQSRFPGAGMPPWFTSAAEYDARVSQLVDCGVLMDTGMSFWLARPSPRLPTVELRVADAAITAEEATLQAALGRALVRTALAELSAGVEAPAVPDQVAAAAVWAAARFGLRGHGVHPVTEQRIPAIELVHELLERVRPALDETGDLGAVRRCLAFVLRWGIGAERQRGAARNGSDAVIHMLAERTAPGCPDRVPKAETIGTEHG